jgi:hypothetical protein
MKTACVAAALLVAIVAAGCARQAGDSHFREALETEIGAAGSGTADLSRLGSKNWTRICILKPYTNNEGAESVLGFKWNSEKYTSIATNDGIVVVVITAADTVESFTEYSRSKGDFASIQPRCTTRSGAKVVNQVPSVGWPQLEWQR